MAKYNKVCYKHCWSSSNSVLNKACEYLLAVGRRVCVCDAADCKILISCLLLALLYLFPLWSRKGHAHVARSR